MRDAGAWVDGLRAEIGWSRPGRPRSPVDVERPGITLASAGGMAERPNARLLKSLGVQVPVGSNPTPSAPLLEGQHHSRWRPKKTVQLGLPRN